MRKQNSFLNVKVVYDFETKKLLEEPKMSLPDIANNRILLVVRFVGSNVSKLLLRY